MGDAACDDELAEWKLFIETREARLRDALIERHSDLARILAARFYRDRQVQEIEFNDYLQYAMIGLIESIDRYELGKGAGFRTYATHRIRGAILNGIEKSSEKQQQISARARLRETRLKVVVSALEAEKDPFMRLAEIAIGTAIGFMLEDSAMFQNEEGLQEHSVYRSHELRDLGRFLRELVALLPKTEQSVIHYHYYQQIPFEEIARMMNLSKGRISQLHRRALQSLRHAQAQLQILRTDY